MLITSLQNPRIKAMLALRKPRDRREAGVILIEGYRPLLRALDNGFRLNELYICPEFYLGENNEALVARAAEAGAQVTEVTAPVFSKITYRDRPEGLLGVAPQFHRRLDELPLDASFFVVAESIEKPGNLGTILRSSDAVGVDGVIVCDPTTDIFNPNVVCASIGTLFTVPVVEAPGAETLAWARRRGIKILAATPHAQVSYTDVDLTVPVAIAVGTEQYGLSETWMTGADLQVRIPMMGQADSLNVATATTILLYEVLRQRLAKAKAVSGENCDGEPRKTRLSGRSERSPVGLGAEQTGREGIARAAGGI